jgi:predicted ester cyclase
MQQAAFPDMQVDAQDVIASGDKVVVRSICTGTNRGELMGMPATGKSVEVQLIDIFRLGGDGLGHEHWGVLDALAIMGSSVSCRQGLPPRPRPETQPRP